ncbi:MAG TPA: S8 family serine peptidase [Thermoanaerobaculia bacterium]|nr:S8 family serine peptidase [Thermoanaerobaculia bacterium]
MRRSLVFLALSLAASSLLAAGGDVIPTHCREIEVPLDATHSAARLGPCSDLEPFDLLWHLDRIDQLSGLDGLYHRNGGGAGAVIYVMDTGVLASHVEFGGRVIAGYDEAEGVKVGRSACSSPNKALQPCIANYDELAGASHGTSVASIIAGRNVGVAPAAKIVSIRVMNEAALATTRTYLAGLEAIIHNAWDPATPPFHTAVVNISGWMLERLVSEPDPSPVPFSEVESKMRAMIGGVDAQGHPDPNGKRFLFVVAANNTDNGCTPAGLVARFPATLGKSIDGMITVGGMTEANDWWPGACRGPVEILAPSENIFSATITANDEYRGTRPNLRSGTSFATPIVSGIAARILSENPNLAPQAVEAMIERTPSRIFDPDASHAQGKVAFVQPETAGTTVLRAAMAP